MREDKSKSINELLVQIQRTRKIEYVESLYDLIAPAIRHIALKYLHDGVLADDLVQDFWADIYKIADGYGFYFNADAYLCRVAKNRALNKYRRVKREKAYVTYVDYSDVQLSSGVAESDHADLIISIEQAMRTLSETERIIIQSAYFEGKTQREIAAELGLSKTTVGRLKNDALENLRAILCSNENGETNENK